MNIIDQLIELKIAKNNFHAAGMLNVLQCQDLPDDEARLARCKLYHEWKQFGETKKEARANALADRPVPHHDFFSPRDVAILGGDPSL